MRELEVRATFDLEMVSVRRVANLIPRGTIPDCPNCTDLCCAGLENIVSLRLRDIATLVDLNRTDLIARKKPNFPKSMLAGRPQLHELVGSQLWRTLPVLKQFGTNRVCAALSDDMKCTLHPHWPTSCERFPYSLGVLRREVFWGKRCPISQQSREHFPRSNELFEAAIAAYNERIKDAILLAHARSALDDLGIGTFLIDKKEDPFEPKRDSLPIIE